MTRARGAEGRDGATAALLAECMLAVAGGRPGLRALAEGAVDWERLLRLARTHAVAETLHHALVAGGVDGCAPPDVREALRAAHEDATARNALLLAEAARVQGALSSEGIPSALLKGAALVAAHYPALGARHVADVDVLVSPDRLEAAVAIATGLGGRPLAPRAVQPAAGKPPPAWEKHAPALVLPSGIVVELHRRYGHDPGMEASTTPMLGRAVEAAWSGRTLRVASPADLLGVACHHVYVSHAGDRRFRPRHLADCAVLLSRGASSTEAAALPGAASPVRRSLSATAQGGRRDLLVSAAWGAAGVRLAGLWSAMTSASFRSLLFPDPDFMAWRYGLPRSSRLLPLLYLWRPFRGAWRVVTGR